MLSLLALLLPALAAPPDRVVASYALGTGIEGLAVSADGRFVGIVETGSNNLRIFNADSWSEETTDLTLCAGMSGVGVVTDGDDVRFYVGCETGKVRWASVASDGTVTAVDGDAAEVGDSPIAAVIGDDDGLFAIEVSDDDEVTVHTIDASTGAVDEGSGFPSSLVHEGFEDAALTSSYLVIAHGGDNVSKLARGTGIAVIEESSWSGADCVDASVASSGDLLLACSEEGVLHFSTSDDLFSFAIGTDDAGEPSALFIDESTDDDEALLVAADEVLRVFPFDPLTGYPDADADDEVSLGAPLIDLTGAGGYFFGASDDGELVVLTDRPWVVASDPVPDTAVSGDEILVEFSADQAGDWSLRLGATDDDGGEELASGTLSADELVSTTFTVDSGFEEGDNTLRVVVEAADGAVGHDAVTLSVDNPPSRVSLSEDNVGYGNRQITIDFDGIDDADLASYTIYVTTTEFARGDYDSDGPSFDGDDDLTLPLTVEAAAEESVSVTLAPLTNGVTYYVAVRAKDTGGQEGPMSSVVSATPQETWSASELSDENGGYCGVPLGASAPLALLGAGLALLRRRRVGAMLGLLVATTGVAQAGEMADLDGAAQMRFGPMWFADDNPIVDVFGDTGNNVLWLEGGPTYLGLIELNLGAGFYQRNGNLIGEDGTSSTDSDMLLAVPFTLGGAVRLDVLKEQPIVPYAAIGGDYWLWREKWDESVYVDGDSSNAGGKYGWHYALGAQLLLDIFEPSRASWIAARSGIQDSYLTAEWRKQTVESDGSGLSFNSTQFTVGLRVHY